MNLEQIESVVTKVARDAKPAQIKLLIEILKSAIQLAKDTPGTLNLKITSTVLKELRYSFKMFYPDRFVPKITVFGSARVKPEEPLYDFAKSFGRVAKENGYKIITGGGPGVMAAGNEGAGKGGGFGLNIRLPFEQHANRFVTNKDGLINYKYFFTRKLFLVKEASAFALFPGGFGTFDETFEALTLLQTGKTELIPVVFLEPKGFGFWESFHRFADKQLIDKGFISPEDKALYKIFHTPENAIAHINLFYKNYHSMRLVKDRLVLRLKNQLDPKVLSKMEQKFGFLSLDGKFEATTALREERNEPEVASLPRLVFPFDRKDFSNLRQLIDFINNNS